MLNDALHKISGALGSINTAMSTVGDNIANANNENYNRKIEVYEDLRFGGARISEIIRLADENLRRDLLNSTTKNSEDEVLRALYDDIEQLLGGGMGHTYLSDTIQNFGDAWKVFEAAPENYAAEREVVRYGNQIAEEFERISFGLDQFETQLKQDIVDQVQEANNLLVKIDSLNENIVRDKSRGISIAEYQNQRDQAMAELAQIVDVKTYRHDNGALTLYTAQGLSLVNLDESQFTWDLNEMSLTLSGNDGNLVGKNLLPGGELGARINLLRADVEATQNGDYKMAPIQKLRNQLDELAYTLIDEASAAAMATYPLNLGEAVTTIEGMNAGDTFAVQAETTDDLGVVTGHTIHNITITSNMTIEELAETINGLTIPAGEPEIRARISAHGTLEISTNDGALLLNDTTGSPLQTMGMINTATARVEERVPPTFTKAYQEAPFDPGMSEVFFETLTGNNLEASRLNFRVNEDLFQGKVRLKDRAGTEVTTALYATNRSINGSGLQLTPMNYLGLASGILADQSGRASHATNMAETSKSLKDSLNTTLRNKVGVDIDEEMMKLTVLENSYAASARALSVIQEMFDALEQAV